MLSEAHELVAQLIQVQNSSRKLDVIKGKLLWMLRANNLYREAFGEGVDTWDEFLRSPEIALTVSEANRAMQLYEFFIVKYGYDEETLSHTPVKSLHHMLPRLKTGEIEEGDLPELIEAAKALTFNEFKERMYDIQHKEEMPRTYTYLIMRRCNETKNLSRVQEVTSEEILEKFPCLKNTH